MKKATEERLSSVALAMLLPLALQQIRQFYPDCKVIQVQGCEELARDGGALHCVTWNVLADVPEWAKEEA